MTVESFTSSMSCWIDWAERFLPSILDDGADVELGLLRLQVLDF